MKETTMPDDDTEQDGVTRFELRFVAEGHVTTNDPIDTSDTTSEEK